MAAIENLEIVVDVDISEAVTKLSQLQDELQDLAESIERVDAQGTEGIDIRTNLDNVEDDLAALKTKIEAFEQSNDIDIDTDVDRGELFSFLDMSPQEFLGRSGLDMDLGTRGPLYDDMFESFADADLDFGGFNVERGRGIDSSRDGMDFSDAVRRARRQLGEMTKGMTTFDLRMSDMHNMMARLIPLLAVFIGVIPAAYTALIGLATAAVAAAASLAAIAGLGALGVGLVGGEFDMARITEMFEQLRSDFISAFAPLAERLQPIFEDAIDGLGRFFQLIAGQGQALMALTDEARAFGGFIMDFVPGALRALAGLVEAMAPIFGDIGAAIESNFNSIVRTLVELTAEAIPAMAMMAQRIAGALPAIIRMSIGFAQVANEIMAFVGFVFQLIGLLGLTPERFGVVTAATLTFASAVALARTRLIQFAVQGLASATMALFNFFRGLILTNNALGYLAVTNIGRAITSMYSFAKSALAGSSALGILTGAEISATSALAAFLTLATFGVAAATLVPMALSAAGAFMGMANGIDQATSSLKEFDRVSGRTDVGGANPYGGEPPSSGAGAANGSSAGGGGGGGNVTINIESSGDPDEDASNTRKTAWRLGRTTGGSN